jgi:hypothetical protein
MSATHLEQEILDIVGRLTPDLQRRVRDFAEALAAAESHKGGSPQALLDWLATWERADATDVARAIEVERERVKAEQRAE